jgi:hypothetical protein
MPSIPPFDAGKNEPVREFKRQKRGKFADFGSRKATGFRKDLEGQTRMSAPPGLLEFPDGLRQECPHHLESCALIDAREVARA